MATETGAGWKPDWAVRPGDILLESLQERGMSQAELARRMNRPLKTINEIVKGKSAITAETAIQLELVLDIPASFWNNLERDYQESLARTRTDEQLAKQASWVDLFPLKDMVTNRLLPRSALKGNTLAELLRFFGVSSPTGWERYWSSSDAAFLRSPSFRSSPQAVSAWLRWGEVKAGKLRCKEFDDNKLEALLPEIRKLSRLDPMAFLPDLRDVLCDCGVAFVLTPELKGTSLSGATRWLTPVKVLVQLSMRHKTDDEFWFPLFHEFGHVLRGPKRRSYLDALESDGMVDHDEQVANQFARDQLIPPEDYRLIVGESHLTEDSVKEFAKRIGVSPGIVVGRLVHDKRLDPSPMRRLKVRYSWPDEVFGWDR